MTFSALPLSEQIALMVHGFYHREHKDEVQRIAREVAALESRLTEAESNYARCASAIGIEDVQDCGPSYPGPIEVVEREIREDARRAALVEEYSEKLSALEARCQVLETALGRCVPALEQSANDLEHATEIMLENGVIDEEDDGADERAFIGELREVLAAARKAMAT